MMSAMMSTDIFYEMPENTNLLSRDSTTSRPDAGPQNYNECVVVLTSSGNISDFHALHPGAAGFRWNWTTMIQQFIDEENVDTPEDMGRLLL